ncbi:MAG: Zn-ribbon domain-containing OB-fold protein [Ktedonobacteraceae bacterium]
MLHNMAKTNDYLKPMPVPEEAFQPFFEGARDHKLMLQRCQACGTATWPVKSLCPTCLHGDLAWVQASGQGVLYSFVLMHQVFHPGFAAEVPYNIAEVDLAEGVRMISNIVGCPNAELRIGMPLLVTFEDLTDEISLPKFKPAEPLAEAEVG